MKPENIDYIDQLIQHVYNEIDLKKEELLKRHREATEGKAHSEMTQEQRQKAESLEEEYKRLEARRPMEIVGAAVVRVIRWERDFQPFRVDYRPGDLTADFSRCCIVLRYSERDGFFFSMHT